MMIISYGDNTLGAHAFLFDLWTAMSDGSARYAHDRMEVSLLLRVVRAVTGLKKDYNPGEFPFTCTDVAEAGAVCEKLRGSVEVSHPKESRCLAGLWELLRDLREALYKGHGLKFYQV